MARNTLKAITMVMDEVNTEDIRVSKYRIYYHPKHDTILLAGHKKT